MGAREMRKRFGVALFIACFLCSAGVHAWEGQKADKPSFFAAGNQSEVKATKKRADDSRVSSKRAWLGIYFEEASSEQRERAKGLVVTKVEPGSPAEGGGIKEGDVIVSFDGVNVENDKQFVMLVMKHRPNDKVECVVKRDGIEKKLKITLGSRADSPGFEALARVSREDDWSGDSFAEIVKKVAPPGSGLEIKLMVPSGRIGIRLHDLDDDLSEYFGVEAGKGVLVLEVLEDSPAQEAGLKAGDVIVAIDGEAVSDAEEFMEKLSEFDPGQKISLEVIRKGTRKTFEVEVERRPGLGELMRGPFEHFEKIRKIKGADTSRSHERLEKEIERLNERVKELERRIEKKADV